MNPSQETEQPRNGAPQHGRCRGTFPRAWLFCFADPLAYPQNLRLRLGGGKSRVAGEDTPRLLRERSPTPSPNPKTCASGSGAATSGSGRLQRELQGVAGALEAVIAGWQAFDLNRGMNHMKPIADNFGGGGEHSVAIGIDRHDQVGRQ